MIKIKRKVAILFLELGPYHIARINKLAENISELTVIEFCSQKYLHDWKVLPDIYFKKICLFNSLKRINKKKIQYKIRKILANIKPEIILIAGYSNIGMREAAKWAKNNNAKTILMTESTYLDKNRLWIIEKIKSYFINKYFDAAFVGGTTSELYLVKLGFSSRKIWKGYDVVDNNYFSTASKSITKSYDIYRKKYNLPKKYFLYVGRFSREKNLIRLILAFKNYAQKVTSPWKLVMVGAGPQEFKLKKLVKLLKISEIVIFTGYKQINDLPVYYSLASCFILPSISEPWGLVINEAMACGLPIISSDRCGCISDIVLSGYNGFILDPKNIKGIMGVLLKVSNMKEDLKKMGTRSRDIISSYNPETWATTLFNCIEKCQKK